MKLKKKRYMYVPITFDEAMTEIRNGNSQSVYVADEHLGLIKLGIVGGVSLGAWMEKTYYLIREMTWL